MGDEDEDVCAEVAELITFYALWFSGYAAVSALVSHRALAVRQLLNPVTSGAAAV